MTEQNNLEHKIRAALFLLCINFYGLLMSIRGLALKGYVPCVVDQFYDETREVGVVYGSMSARFFADASVADAASYYATGTDLMCVIQQGVFGRAISEVGGHYPDEAALSFQLLHYTDTRWAIAFFAFTLTAGIVLLVDLFQRFEKVARGHSRYTFVWVFATALCALSTISWTLCMVVKDDRPCVITKYREKYWYSNNAAAWEGNRENDMVNIMVRVSDENPYLLGRGRAMVYSGAIKDTNMTQARAYYAVGERLGCAIYPVRWFVIGIVNKDHYTERQTVSLNYRSDENTYPVYGFPAALVLAVFSGCGFLVLCMGAIGSMYRQRFIHDDEDEEALLEPPVDVIERMVRRADALKSEKTYEKPEIKE